MRLRYVRRKYCGGHYLEPFTQGKEPGLLVNCGGRC